MIKKNDYIQVKDGTKEPDSEEIEIGGWQGKIKHLYTHEGRRFIEIDWTLDTIKKMPIDYIKVSIEEGFSFSEMHLGADDVIKIDPLKEDEKARVQYVDELKSKYSEEEAGAQQKRIAEILSIKDTSVSQENLLKFRTALLKYLNEKTLLTGIQEYGWEERYVLGFGSKEEYAALRKENASYADHFKFLSLSEIEIGDWDLYINVSRVSDDKKFELKLSNLKAEQGKLGLTRMLEDFVVWVVNS